MKKKNQEQQKGKLKLNKERIMALSQQERNYFAGGISYMKTRKPNGNESGVAGGCTLEDTLN